MNKIAVIEYLSGKVTVNGSPAEEGQQLKYTDEVNSREGTCMVKFLKSMRLEDISNRECNIGSLALLHEKSIILKSV